jgi:adenylate cyclase
VRARSLSLHVMVSGSLLALVLGLRAFDPGGLLQAVRLNAFDYYQRVAPRAYQPVPVRIIDIDDESLTRIGQWPWPRTRIAEIVDRLTAAGAAVIGFDIVFSEPDRTSPNQVARQWADDPRLRDLRQAIAGLPDHDTILADSLRASAVVTAFALTNQPGAARPAAKFSFAVVGDDPTRFLHEYPGFLASLAPIEAAAAGNGAANHVQDHDGVVRRLPLVLRGGGALAPSLSAEMLRVAQGARTIIVKATGASGESRFGAGAGIVSVKIGDAVLPTDSSGQIWLHMTPPQPDRSIPAWRILNGDFPAERIAGHIVLVGASATGLGETFTTPLAAATPSVEIHAQVIEQVLLGHYLQRPDWADGAEILFIVVLGAVLILLLEFAGAVWCGLAGGLAVAAVTGLAAWVYVNLGGLVDPVTPSVATLAVYLSGSLMKYASTEKEKERVRDAFGRYLAPALVEQLARDPAKLQLGGERRAMTFMFADIRGFTPIAEYFQANPSGLTQLISRFMTAMTDVILARQGTIDKYIGDCVMAFWNAPLADPDHAVHACEAALDMMAALDRLNAELAAEHAAAGAGQPGFQLKIGIGVNTGDCIVGNMGSKQRFDYTVMGDAVNLASRLESLSKDYGVGMVIGEATARQVPDFATLELDLVAVKGKREATRVYALLGGRGLAADAGFRALRQRHDEMLAAFRAGQWDRASAANAACRALPHGVAGLCDLYDQRIAQYRREPPGPDWQGGYAATRK